MNKLRDYQTEICRKVNAAFGTHRSVMLQMPTGTGKTVVLASLVRQYLGLDPDADDGADAGRRGAACGASGAVHCRVLIVAHRIELVTQTRSLLQRFGIDSGMIADGRWPAAPERVMVASVQTLSKKQGSNLAPSFVVIDEAHHAPAQTYKRLWTAWPEAKFLGLTATPYRMSGEGFTDLFEVMVDSWSIRQFISAGWLSPYDYYSIRPDSEDQRVIDSLRKRGADGDFQMKELREKLDVRPSIERLYEAFAQYAADKKGIVYAIDIAHAEHIAAYYRQQGVGAVAISSQTPSQERQRLLALFKDNLGRDGHDKADGGAHFGAIQIMVSVDLFSEGFDCPDVEFIQLARPTLSLAKYLQMVGRGLRPGKDKRCCTMIDNVGLYRTFGLPSVERDWDSLFHGTNPDIGRDCDRNEQFLWLGSGDLREDGDGDVVKIASHEDMQMQGAAASRTGFLRRQKGRAWVWEDQVSGVTFDRHPRVVNYRGIELATADGDTFYPRVRSRWIDTKHGINRKALETQVGEGIGWMKRYISLAKPDRVLRLLSVRPNHARIYTDEQGGIFLRQDPDHAPVSEAEAGGIEAFMARCDSRQRAWAEARKTIGRQALTYDAQTQWWQLPAGSVKTLDDDRHGAAIYRIIYSEQGERRAFWLDATSGMTYRHRPVIRRRGFVDLLFDGATVYVLNIREERYIPYRNWEIRADERICTIGNKLYFSEEKDAGSYRIKRRSDDFRMFVVEERRPRTTLDRADRHALMIINKAGQEVEVKRV